jgi:SAM-dependent methyltransferase
MLQRILEPKVMDTDEDAREYDAMDHAAVNAVFAADLLDALSDWSLQRPVQSGNAPPPPTELKILDLGAGTAQIPIELCHRMPNVQVVAVDAAASMLAVACANVAAAGLTDRIELVHADAKRLPYPAASFSLQAVGVEMLQSFGQGQPDPQAFAKGQPRIDGRPRLERLRLVSLRIEIAAGDGMQVIRQLHHIVEAIVTTPDLQHIHLARVGAGDGFKLLDALKFPLERPIRIERLPVHNLHRAKRSENALRQPDFAIAAGADTAQQFVIGNGRRNGRGAQVPSGLGRVMWHQAPGA